MVGYYEQSHKLSSCVRNSMELHSQGGATTKRQCFMLVSVRVGMRVRHW
jgi:hypothetical protein